MPREKTDLKLIKIVEAGSCLVLGCISFLLLVVILLFSSGISVIGLFRESLAFGKLYLESKLIKRWKIDFGRETDYAPSAFKKKSFIVE